MKMTFRPLFILVLCISYSGLNAQHLGLNYSLFKAQGEFNRNIDHDPGGVNISYVHTFEDSPWSIGGDFGVAMYSSKEYFVQNSDGEEVSIYEEDCFWNFHALAQYNVYSTDLLVVYGEGRTGFTTFFSQKYAGDDNEELGGSETHGTAFNLGAGAGMRLNMSGIVMGDPGSYQSIWLDMAVTANSGSRSNYRNVSEGVRTITDANHRSLTDYTHIRIGLSYLLGS